MSIKTFISKTLSNFFVSLSKVFIKKEDIINNLTSSYTDKPQAAYQGKVLNERSITSYSINKNISSAGWYRIAKFSNVGSTQMDGSSVNSVTITIKRMWNYIPPEFHEIKFIGLFQLSEFRSIFNKSQNCIITKIRHTVDYNTNSAYIEIFYNSDSPNSTAWFLHDTMDSLGAKWEAIFEATSETVDGVAVRSSMDIPANDN